MRVLFNVIAFFISGPIFAAEMLTVTTEQGQPLAGAEVMIGTTAGAPFQNNILKTDVNGQLEMPTEWQNPEPVTVSASGYLHTSFMQVSPLSLQIQLHPADSRNPIEIKGKATEFGALKSDGRVDFALVYPSLRRRDLVQFNVGHIVSPEIDEIKIITETAQLPSNLSLPQQKESYILPVTLSKPVYRMYVGQTGNYRIMASHGRFPFKQVINDMREGKSFLEIINHFKFIGSGQRDVVVESAIPSLDIPVNQIPYDRGIDAQAPAQIPPNMALIMFSMVDQAGLYFPADVKSVVAGQSLKLFVPSESKSNYIVSLMLDKSAFDNKPKSTDEIADETDKIDDPSLSPFNISFLVKTISASLEKALNIFRFNNGENGPEPRAPQQAVSIAVHPETRSQATLLDLISPPVRNTGSLSLQAPKIMSGIRPLATLVVLSEIEKADPKSQKIPKRFRIWEILNPDWVNQVQLPETALTLDPKKRYSWEVLYLGRADDDTSNDGAYILDQVTHITRNTVEF